MADFDPKGDAAEVVRQRGLLDRCKAMLVEHEWVALYRRDAPWRVVEECPECDAPRGGDHAPGCELATLLRDLGGSDV